MKELSKKQREEKIDWLDRIKEAKEKLEWVIGGYNSAVGPLKEQVGNALDHLNDTISQADIWREEVHKEQEEHLENTSTKWQDSDAGEQFRTWMEAWGEYLEPVEHMEMPDLLEALEVDAYLALQGMPDEYE